MKTTGRVMERIDDDDIEGGDMVECEECHCYLLLSGTEHNFDDGYDEPGKWLGWTCDNDACEDYAHRWVPNPFLRCYGDLRMVHPDEVGG